MMGYSRTIFGSIYLFSLGTVFLMVLFNVGLCEKVKWEPCSSKTTEQCKILDVSLDPCPEAEKGEVCKVRRGTNVTWSFNYIPKFEANKDTLTIKTYGKVAFFYVAWPGQDSHACRYTKCPFKSGEERHVKYPTYVDPSYPTWSFRVKWRLYNDNDQECCFLSDIVIVD